ncbi:MAG: DNA repair protein RecO [Rhodobacteraceae bacterium]|nr:DNA repair protein RecO [Paracoccaceae bacterium]
MEWRDTGILLSSRPHGEAAAIIEMFTPEYGRHAGVVRGGTGRKLSPHLQPGAQLDVTWRARLEDHLGSFTIEPLRARAALVMTDRFALSGMTAVLATLAFALPEREPHPTLYVRSERLLDLLGQNEIWPLAFLQWELSLLETLGFALDLSACAVTGATEGLVYISPKSGRAVSAEGAGDWASRLLPLPPVMRGCGDASDAEIAIALETTGHFLQHHVAAQLQGRPLPKARQQFLDRLTRRAGQR